MTRSSSTSVFMPALRASGAPRQFRSWKQIVTTGPLGSAPAGSQPVRTPPSSRDHWAMGRPPGHSGCQVELAQIRVDTYSCRSSSPWACYARVRIATQSRHLNLSEIDGPSQALFMQAIARSRLGSPGASIPSLSAFGNISSRMNGLSRSRIAPGTSNSFCIYETR
jgi:hypothetical protein